MIIAVGASPEDGDKVKKFVDDLVLKYIGTDTRIGLVTFRKTTKTHLELETRNINSIRAAVSSMKFESGTLQTPTALATALDAFEIKSSSQRKKALVVLTDGNTVDVGRRTGFTLVREQSIKLHNLGVQVLAIWYSKSKSSLELKAMASFPKSRNALYILGPSYLPKEAQIVAATTLRGKIQS